MHIWVVRNEMLSVCLAYLGWLAHSIFVEASISVKIDDCTKMENDCIVRSIVAHSLIGYECRAVRRMQ